jgi:hypothetical protein
MINEQPNANVNGRQLLTPEQRSVIASKRALAWWPTKTAEERKEISKKAHLKARRFVSPDDLLLAQADPELEKNRGWIADFVICRVSGCGQKFAAISDKHLRTHGLTWKAYKAMWPGTPRFSDKERANREKLQQKYDDQYPERRKRYARTSRAKHHDKQLAARRAKNGSVPREVYLQVLANWRTLRRPVDWDRKPIDWRIIGNELLCKESMSNKELADRLDAARILTCPYGDKGWTEALKYPGRAANFISDIRKWVKKPGQTPLTKKPSITSSFTS